MTTETLNPEYTAKVIRTFQNAGVLNEQVIFALSDPAMAEHGYALRYSIILTGPCLGLFKIGDTVPFENLLMRQATREQE